VANIRSFKVKQKDHLPTGIDADFARQRFEFDSLLNDDQLEGLRRGKRYPKNPGYREPDRFEVVDMDEVKRRKRRNG
jgi:hypothetical protein